MKRTIAAAVAVAAVLASALPVLADDRDHHDDRGRYQNHHAPPHRGYADAHRYREGQVWHGHRLAYRGGRWGYYQPRNGVNLFVNIPL